MKTRERNIYSIGRAWGAPCLLAACALLAIGAAPALAGCEDLGGAGDQYCEGVPGAGNQQGVGKPRINRGVPEATGRKLDREGAGAVRLVESPRHERSAGGGGGGATAPPSAGVEGPSGGGGTALPYILAALSLVLLGAALVARRRRNGGGTEEAAP